jgi:hypothetical protein|nr:MAG TPA: hypothetical protein [Caudoviricetes sp.]
MEKDVFNDGIIVYRNLFTKIIKCNDQTNVRHGYTKYKVLNDNNIIMVFACKDNDNPYQKYIENKNK